MMELLLNRINPKLVLAVFCGVLMLGLGIRTWTTRDLVGAPWYQIQMKIIKHKSGEETLEGIQVIQVEPNIKRYITIPIDLKTQVESVANYGFYSIEALYRLGKIEGVGYRLAAESVAWRMGVPISNIYITNRNLSSKFIWSNKLRLIMARGILEIPKILDPNWQDKQLDVTPAIVSVQLGDGTVVNRFDSDLFDTKLAPVIKPSWSKGIGISVSVINASGMRGLGLELGRVISMMGNDVVSVRDGLGETEGIVSGGGERMYFDVDKVLVPKFVTRINSATKDEINSLRSKVGVIIGDRWGKRLRTSEGFKVDSK